jgi:hypothetical protein
MDAFKIALETVFVGVLALPWLALAAQLFFPDLSLPEMSERKGWLTTLKAIKSDTVAYPVVGILSVAMVYTLGAAVSRLAQDFFSDDDLRWHLPTEDEIRASVYCDEKYSPWVVDDSGASFPDGSVGSLQIRLLCRRLSAASDKREHKRERDSIIDQMQRTFHLQEAALLLAGDDKVSRIRLLHQQLNVLRGAAFDGIIACLMCLFGWCAHEEKEWKRWPWEILGVGLFGYAFYSLAWNHLQVSGPRNLFLHPSSLFRPPDDPPFMEFTLLLVAALGCYAIARGVKCAWPRWTILASLLFTALAYSGWYWTEILYDQLIMQSFYAGYSGQHPLLRLTQ